MRRLLVKRSEEGIVLLTLLWFGVLWGAVEALFGGLLHLLLPPTYPGKVMIALAVGLMAYAVRRTGKPWVPLGMALIAAPLKLFSAVVFALPVSAPEVMNPAFAILAQGAAFSLVAVALQRRPVAVPLRFGLIGAGAGALQSLLFVGLVRGPGLWIYPPLTVLQELGTKFPSWALSASGIASYLSISIPYSALAGGVAALAVGFPPLRTRAYRPPFLLAGTALCLVIFFLASWFI
jgi:hypothetical protein